MSKIFLTYSQQIHKLVHEKHLIISNYTYAKNKLQELSYFSLISGYKEPFKHMPSGNYLRNVTFEEIVAFYYFDEALRSLFFQYILHIEKSIKSMLSYYFCEKYGADQKEYLNICNYNLSQKNYSNIQKLICTLQSTIKLPSNYPYITHHLKKYGNVPLWVTMNALTFGNISAMYQYVTSDIRTKISINFPNVTEQQLHQFIRVISMCRNVCAHGERLYCFHCRVSIPDTLLHQKLNITQKHSTYKYGKHDLFSVVISLRYLLPKEDFKIFKRQLSLLIRKVLANCPHLTQEKLFNYMGFPKNWDKILRFKI